MKNSIKNITLIIFISFSYSFAQWEQINNGIPNVSINCLEFNNNKIYAGTDIGFYTSTNNGATWVNEGYMNSFFRINTFISNNSQIYVGMKNQGIIQNDNGFSLYKHNQQLVDLNVNLIKVGNKNNMYLSNIIYKSLNIIG